MALAVGWLIMIDRCFELSTQGFLPLTLRYEDLNAQPERVLTAVFDCLRAAGQPACRQRFRRSPATRRRTPSWRAATRTVAINFNFPATPLYQIQALLDRQPTIRRSDFVLPGTLRFD